MSGFSAHSKLLSNYMNSQYTICSDKIRRMNQRLYAYKHKHAQICLYTYSCMQCYLSKFLDLLWMDYSIPIPYLIDDVFLLLI